MKKTTDKQQYLKLKEIIGFPSPDTFTEGDSKISTASKKDQGQVLLFNEDEMSSPIPSWTIGRMIAGLPGSITYCRCLEDDDDFVTYGLRINTMFKENLVRVTYESIVDENIVYLEATAKELCDAIYKMVLEVDKEGWFKAFYENELNWKKKSKFGFPEDEQAQEFFSMNEEKYFIDKYLESMKVVSELDDAKFRKLRSELDDKENLIDRHCVIRLDVISKTIEDIVVFYAYKDCITLRASYRNWYIGQRKPHVLYPDAFCEARKIFFQDVPEGAIYEWMLI